MGCSCLATKKSEISFCLCNVVSRLPAKLTAFLFQVYFLCNNKAVFFFRFCEEIYGLADLDFNISPRGQTTR